MCIKRFILAISAFACLTALLTTTSSAQHRHGARHRARPAVAAPVQNNGCDLSFTGSSRKAVKLRSTSLNYPFQNGGRAISVTDFFASTCPLDVNVPTKKGAISETQPMDSEKVTIKIRAFVMAMKRDPDNDLHVQIADAASPYKQQQLIVEIPPGADYCDARSALMDLFRADGGTKLASYIFKHPPHVELTGYLFLDKAHMRAGRTDFCTNNGGRGIKGNLSVSPVRGIWEIHPVFKLESVR
ncbi:MAG: hypothetical protein QOE33_498 [Acidobacteriota bacterium]|nr:hypothetical protein [Acidobacteriota bacterium]